MSEDKRYTLVVRGMRIPVTEEVYREYYRHKEREAYMDKLSARHNLSFEECEEKGIPIDYILSQIQESTEDKLIREEMTARLSAAIKSLTEQERLLVHELFFLGKSERVFCAEMGIAKTTLHDRKQKILGKLKNIIEI